MADVTQILAQADQGDSNVMEQLLPLVYDELRRLARAKLNNERSDHTLQATALVHEAYLRLLGDGARVQTWNGRGHFFAAASLAMQRILIESIRSKSCQKRGGEFDRIEFSEVDIPAAERDQHFLALDAALERLTAVDPVKANLVRLRFFAGLTQAEAASALGLSRSTADRHWAYARAWLQAEIYSG